MTDIRRITLGPNGVVILMHQTTDAEWFDLTQHWMHAQTANRGRAEAAWRVSAYALLMLREGPIPQAMQGLLEYVAGILFVAAPFFFGFTDEGVATAASIVFGIVFLVLAATSAGPTGLVKQVSPVAHVLLDAVLAILLIAAPFVLGFSGTVTPRNLFLISGVIWLLVTIGSRYEHRVTPPTAPAQPAHAPATGPLTRPAPASGPPITSAPTTGAAPAGRDGSPTGGDRPIALPRRVGPDYGPPDDGIRGS